VGEVGANNYGTSQAVVPPGDSLKYKVIRATIRATKIMCLEE